MKRKDTLPELLAPAGDFECLVAAVRGGADAVYLGGRAFGARAFAKNFDMAELERAIAYCHIHGVRLYVTVNTLLTTAELEEAADFCRTIYGMGVDAIIIADLGLVSLLRETAPHIELHASTQMSIHNTEGADLAYDLGCTRVVLARELSGKNIAAVTAACRAEVEVFVHGALCVSHSGQCLFSSLVGGRSGNRGECAQPCRLPWGKGDAHPLSLRDLSLADHIRELCDSGVASLKIEGRMKSADYVYTVVSTYRALLDAHRDATKRESELMARTFSRGGFTDGYFIGELFATPMTGIRSAADKEQSRLIESGSYTPDRLPIRAEVSIRRGAASTLKLTMQDGRSATFTGDIPDEARSAPLTADAVRQRIAKMGSTYFELSPSDITVELDDGLNLSPAAINGLRRGAVSALERACLVRSEAPVGSINSRISQTIVDNKTNLRTALFFDPTTYAEACTTGGVLNYFDVCFLPLWRIDELDGDLDNIGLYIPPVIMQDEWDEVLGMVERAVARGARYALLSNLSHLSIAVRYSLCPVADMRLNITNTRANELWHTLGVNHIIASAEMGLAAAAELGGAVIYGRIPLMLTERCFMKENFGCDRCSRCALTDRRGVSFPIIREFRHRNIILNSAVTYMGDKARELRRANLGTSHFIFTDESVKALRSVIDGYNSARPLPNGVQFRRMGRRTSERERAMKNGKQSKSTAE